MATTTRKAVASASKVAASTRPNSSSSPSRSSTRLQTKAPATPPTIPDLPTPALDRPSLRHSYAIGRGETGVLTFEPYKSLLLPYWAFRTVPVAHQSSQRLGHLFASYVRRGDFVGADMARKFLQMGMTRARRYANHKGGRKYDARGTGKKELPRWEGGDEAEVQKRREKEEASEVFKKVWRRCLEDEGYQALKKEWIAETRKVRGGGTDSRGTSRSRDAE